MVSCYPLQILLSGLQRKVTLNIQLEQSEESRESEQEVLEIIKLGANGPELFKGKSH